MPPIPFATLVHADWSMHPHGRWAVRAGRIDGGWRVEAPFAVPDLAGFVDCLAAERRPCLAGFDFPIGVPREYGARTGLVGFAAALDQFGYGAWARFYDVGERPEDVSVHRPFYPRVSTGAARQAHLLAGLGLPDGDALRRRCERRTSDRPAASPLFWTLGAAQVGKAAIAGWRGILQPARAAGARLWPFDGPLRALAEDAALVLCETYPAEAYRHVGLRFGSGMSKRRREDRRAVLPTLPDRCARAGVAPAASLAAAIADGFGADRAGEDRFDALLGLLGMIEVVDGRRAEAPPDVDALPWEGWILGQAGP